MSGERRLASTLAMGLCGLATIAVGNERAHAQTVVDWDCFLSAAPVECAETETAYFGSIPGLERRGAEGAPITVRLRSVAVDEGRRYFADFEGRPFGSAAGTRVAFTLEEQIASSAGHDRSLMLVVALLQRGTVPFLRVPTPGAPTQGAEREQRFVLEADASGASDARDSTIRSATGWYVRPAVSAQIARVGFDVVEVSGELLLGYSDRDWRWLLTGEGKYRYLDIELPGGRLEGGFAQGWGSATLARSLGAGLHAAALASARHQPQNNLDGRLEAGLGIEWMLRELLRADEGNVGVQYRAVARWDQYATDTVQHQRERIYAHHGLRAFARWHLDRFDLDASAAWSSVVDQPSLWDLGASLKLTLRLIEGLELSLTGSILYRHGAVHAPADPAALDPIAVIVAGSDFGTLTYSTGVTLAYTFGNSLLYAQDQRWRP